MYFCHLFQKDVNRHCQPTKATILSINSKKLGTKSVPSFLRLCLLSHSAAHGSAVNGAMCFAHSQVFDLSYPHLFATEPKKAWHEVRAKLFKILHSAFCILHFAFCIQHYLKSTLLTVRRPLSYSLTTMFTP